MEKDGSKQSGARQRALYYMSLKERSVREVEAYLVRKGYDTETASSVSTSLQASGLINDVRLADILARTAPERGWGPARVRQEMQKRGISRENADEAMERFLSEDEYLDTALAAGRKNWRSGRGDVKARKARVSGYLKRRGFSTGTIIKVLDQLSSEETGGDPFP
jgi:regulatory protein